MATLQELVEHMVGRRQLNDVDSGIHVVDWVATHFLDVERTQFISGKQLPCSSWWS